MRIQIGSQIDLHRITDKYKLMNTAILVMLGNRKANSAVTRCVYIIFVEGTRIQSLPCRKVLRALRTCFHPRASHLENASRVARGISRGSRMSAGSAFKSVSEIAIHIHALQVISNFTALFIHQAIKYEYNYRMIHKAGFCVQPSLSTRAYYINNILKGNFLKYKLRVLALEICCFRTSREKNVVRVN